VNIKSVPVFVNDQQRALEFYRDKLGFEVVMDMPVSDGVRWLTVAPPNHETEFILFPPAMAGDGGSDDLRSRVGSWTGIVLTTDDCRGTYRRLIEQGVKFAAEPRRQVWGGWMTEMSDPDNNRFQLVERPPNM
jgi:predicted enzyme related to lactoylglutathione lyase